MNFQISTSRARQVGALGLALGALSLGGCASGGADAGSGVARSWGEVWQRVRLSLAIGRAYDDGLMAARNEDSRRFEQARRDLQSLDEAEAARSLSAQAPLSDSEREVARGIYWSGQARQANADQRAGFEQKEAAAYRRALEMSPKGDFQSSNGQILNALGYFLADKGASRADFERAEKLTRAALKQYDADVEAERHKSGEQSAAFAVARLTRANTRDSLAWALFNRAGADARDAKRAGVLLEQARREQQAALDEEKQASAALGSGAALSAEIPYHLAVILYAQDVLSPSDTRRAQVASLADESLKREPGFEPAQKFLDLAS